MNVVFATWKLFPISSSVSIGSQQPSCLMPKTHLLSVVCRWISYYIYIYLFPCLIFFRHWKFNLSNVATSHRDVGHLVGHILWYPQHVSNAGCMPLATNKFADRPCPSMVILLCFICSEKCWCGFWHILVWTTVTITEHQFTSEGLKMVPDKRIIAKWWVPRK